MREAVQRSFEDTGEGHATTDVRAACGSQWVGPCTGQPHPVADGRDGGRPGIVEDAGAVTQPPAQQQRNPSQDLPDPASET